jgi:hypothetical protein
MFECGSAAYLAMVMGLGVLVAGGCVGYAHVRAYGNRCAMDHAYKEAMDGAESWEIIV